MRTLFNHGVERNIITDNPTKQIGFLPVEKRKKYIPLKGDVTKVIYGNRESREIPMVPKLYDILHFRYQQRDVTIPWVFWHEYWCRTNRKWIKAPFKDRKKIMGTLCRRANVKYFRYHPIRHLTASVLDNMGVSIGVIQRILGHQKRKTTEIYLHSFGDAERKAMNKLQEVEVFSKMDPALLEGPINKGRSTWQRRVNRPPFKILKAEIEQSGFAAVGRKYGVSDNAVRKWMKAYSEPKVQINFVRGGKVTQILTRNEKGVNPYELTP